MNSRFRINVMSICHARDSLGNRRASVGFGLDSAAVANWQRLVEAIDQRQAVSQLVNESWHPRRRLFPGRDLGVIVGLLMGRFREVEHFLDLYINALMSAPMTAFVPVLILWFGLGVESRIAVVFLFAFFVIVINTMTGVKQVDRTFLEMARSFGAKETEIFFKIILPAAMPAIMAGVRLGMGRAVKGMVTAEMLLTLTGIGAMIMQYGSAFATDALFAVILTILSSP